MISLNNSTTRLFLEHELYKCCYGTDTSDLIGIYDHRSVWSPADIIQRCIRACLHNTSIEDICSSEVGPSADTVHRRLNELRVSQVEELINRWLAEIVSRLKFHGNTKVAVSFDDHFLPFYGDSDYEWVGGSKATKATHYGVIFTVVTITSGTIRCPFRIHLQTKSQRTKMDQFVANTLDAIHRWLPVKRVYMDRWFSYQAIIEVLEFRGLEYVIAARKWGDIKWVARTIEDTTKHLAQLAGIDPANEVALGRWVKKHQLAGWRVTNVRLKRRGGYGTLVAVWARHWEHTRHGHKKESYTSTCF